MYNISHSINHTVSLYPQNEAIREVRLCYESIKRKEDVIQVKDCVMLRSGVKRKDLPFVAKVSALWEDPESGEYVKIGEHLYCRLYRSVIGHLSLSL